MKLIPSLEIYFTTDTTINIKILCNKNGKVPVNATCHRCAGQAIAQENVVKNAIPLYSIKAKVNSSNGLEIYKYDMVSKSLAYLILICTVNFLAHSPMCSTCILF